MQQPDWNSVFAPTVRYTTLRTLLAIACYDDLEIEQMDVVTAFLNADVVNEIFMEQPEGFKTISKDGSRLVCRLKKALYGIREAPKVWNELFTQWLISYGFNQSLVDPGSFTILNDNLLYILALYVDDCILVGKFGEFITKFKTDLASRFDIEDLGPASWLLGCSITRDRDRRLLRFGQSQYVSDILDEFGMASCSPTRTPMAA